MAVLIIAHPFSCSVCSVRINARIGFLIDIFIHCFCAVLYCIQPVPRITICIVNFFTAIGSVLRVISLTHAAFIPVFSVRSPAVFYLCRITAYAKSSYSCHCKHHSRSNTVFNAAVLYRMLSWMLFRMLCCIQCYIFVQFHHISLSPYADSICHLFAIHLPEIPCFPLLCSMAYCSLPTHIIPHHLSEIHFKSA